MLPQNIKSYADLKEELEVGCYNLSAVADCINKHLESIGLDKTISSVAIRDIKTGKSKTVSLDTATFLTWFFDSACRRLSKKFK